MPNNCGALWQSFYISESIPVLDHPLAPRTKTESTWKLPVSTDEAQSADDFADPLGVCDVLKTETPILKPNKESKSSNSSDGPLSNTLLENLTVEQDDGDPDFIGFKPWREYRSLIKTEFHSKDLLCLETSFLKTSSTKHVRKKRLVQFGKKCVLDVGLGLVINRLQLAFFTI